MNTLKDFKHVNPKTIEEAISLLNNDGAQGLAGGTDLLGTMRFKIFPDELYPKTIVNLKSISPSMEFIKEDNGILRIGALTLLEDIAESSIVQGKWAALAEAAHKTASPHLREMGTIGGNICQHNRCWYYWANNNRFNCIRKGGGMCYAMAGDNRYHSIFGAVSACVAVNPSDTAPALVALNATIKTNKRDIPAEEFWAVGIPGSTILDKGEIVTEIQVPAFSGKSAFIKFTLRSSIDFPIVNCAAAIGNGEARICMNAVSGTPRRAVAAEDYIKGKTINAENAEAAGSEAVQGSVALTAVGSLPGNKWKIQVAKGIVKKVILACS